MPPPAFGATTLIWLVVRAGKSIRLGPFASTAAWCPDWFGMLAQALPVQYCRS